MPNILHNFQGSSRLSKSACEKLDVSSEPGQRIVIPKGLIDPNTTTLIEIPAEFTKESIIFAKPIVQENKNNYKTKNLRKNLPKNKTCLKSPENTQNIRKPVQNVSTSEKWNTSTRHENSDILNHLKKVEELEDYELQKSVDNQLKELQFCRREKIRQIADVCFEEFVNKNK